MTSSTPSSLSTSSFPEEIVLKCTDGIILAGQRYRTGTTTTINNNNNNNNNGGGGDGSSGSQSTCRILCWHGWLDNCRSFFQLGSSLLLLNGTNTTTTNGNNDSSSSSFASASSSTTTTRKVEIDIDMVALDFPGHGKSSHKSLDGPTSILMDYAYYIHEAIYLLGWDKNKRDGGGCNLIGHSMGAAICLLYTAAFPDTVHKLVLLDSLGPQTKPTEQVVTGFRTHIQQRLTGKPKCSIYENLQVAIETRQATAKLFPGNHQYISKEAATELVLRASIPLSLLTENTTTTTTNTTTTTSTTSDSHDGNNDRHNQRIQFLHDQRLKWTSMLSLTQEQVDQVCRDIASFSNNNNDDDDDDDDDDGSDDNNNNKTRTTKTCILLAKDGMPFDSKDVNRMKELLKPTIMKTLSGSHHFHMDPDTCTGVTNEIIQFLEII